MTGEFFSVQTLLLVSAPFAGGLAGVAFAPDFASLTWKAKTWRVFISALITLFVAPFIVERFFPDSPPSESTFWSFFIAAVSFAVGPVLIKRVVTYAKRVNVNLKDEA